MINLSQAKAIADEELGNSEIQLVVTKIQEVVDGWIFYYQSKDFLEGGGESTRLAGNLPFIVLRSTGCVEDLHSGKSIEQWLATYGGSVQST